MFYLVLSICCTSIHYLVFQDPDLPPFRTHGMHTIGYLEDGLGQ
jgi:hypothetical protein